MSADSFGISVLIKIIQKTYNPKYLANLPHMDFLSDLVGSNAVYMSTEGDWSVSAPVMWWNLLGE